MLWHWSAMWGPRVFSSQSKGYQAESCRCLQLAVLRAEMSTGGDAGRALTVSAIGHLVDRD